MRFHMHFSVFLNVTTLVVLKIPEVSKVVHKRMLPRPRLQADSKFIRVVMYTQHQLIKVTLHGF
jgi:hypothetical protein